MEYTQKQVDYLERFLAGCNEHNLENLAKEVKSTLEEARQNLKITQ